MVMVGALLKDAFEKSLLTNSFSPPASAKKAAEINKKSILEGMHYLENKKSCHC
jgi:hypothetical protein